MHIVVDVSLRNCTKCHIGFVMQRRIFGRNNVILYQLLCYNFFAKGTPGLHTTLYAAKEDSCSG